MSDCAKIHRTTTVISPEPSILKEVKKGSVGKLRLGVGARQPVEIVVPGGKVLGTIGGEGITRIKQCLEEGHKFSATITEIRGGAVTVEIRAS